jgi:hypothetical protein
MDVALPVPPSSTAVAWPILRQPSHEPEAPGSPRHAAAPEAQVEAPDDGPLLCCIQCQHPITTESRRMTVSGLHRHVFANPHGFVFEIGCFSSAPGCAAVGPFSSEFSWFPETSWQIAVCTVCGLHLGWRYEKDASGDFYGLILDRLTSAVGSPIV